MAILGSRTTELDPPQTRQRYRLPPSAQVGKVRLAVSSLDRSVAFYRDAIGLAVKASANLIAQLGPHGDSSVLLELEELPGLQPIQQRSRLGLYHTAFLLPTRAALSSFVKHLWKLGMPFGAGDHWVSEAIYLVDPDGLEVEVYADRPRAQWSSGGLPLRMGTEAVRFDELARVTDETWHGAPAGTTLGHIHLYIGDLHRAADFYVFGLGLDIMLQIPTALFASAGGYHHHVGLNVWAAGSPVASERDARLLFWELVLPDAEEVQHVAESLLLAGYAEAETEDSTRRFADAWGIVVELAVSC